MYHIEFYKKILKIHNVSDNTFLSGIVGDIWAGSINYKSISGWFDLINLGYTHGLNLDTKYLINSNENLLKKSYFKEHQKYFENDKLNAVFTIRMKLILISYLTQIPEYFGMSVWTPFLNFETVKLTLSLPEVRRNNRVWQKQFFESISLDLENMNLNSNKGNNLDFSAARNANLDPINISVMSEYIDANKLIEINSRLKKQTELDRVKNVLLKIPKVGGGLRRLGMKNDYLNSLHEYYVIKAIEKGLCHEL
jgi:hypothetical protein